MSDFLKILMVLTPLLGGLVMIGINLQRRKSGGAIAVRDCKTPKSRLGALLAPRELRTRSDEGIAPCERDARESEVIYRTEEGQHTTDLLVVR